VDVDASLVGQHAQQPHHAPGDEQGEQTQQRHAGEPQAGGAEQPQQLGESRGQSQQHEQRIRREQARTGSVAAAQGQGTQAQTQQHGEIQKSDAAQLHPWARQHPGHDHRQTDQQQVAMELRMQPQPEAIAATTGPEPSDSVMPAHRLRRR